MSDTSNSGAFRDLVLEVHLRSTDIGVTSLYCPHFCEALYKCIVYTFEEMAAAFCTTSAAFTDPELALVSLRQPVESTPEALDLDSYSQEERRLNLFTFPFVCRSFVFWLLSFSSY